METYNKHKTLEHKINLKIKITTCLNKNLRNMRLREN